MARREWFDDPVTDSPLAASLLNDLEARKPEVEYTPLNVKDNGAVGDGLTNDSTAIQALIDSVAAISGSHRIVFPPGIYKLNTGLTWSNKTIHLEGVATAQSMPFAEPNGTALWAATGVTAITCENGVNGGGGRSVIENLHIVSQDTGAGSACGIIGRANSVAVIGCAIEGFGLHGIHILSGQDGSPFVAEAAHNANKWFLSRVRCYDNFGDGLRVEGVDSNAGNAVGLDSTDNGGYGVYDNSAFGNVYDGTHFDGNNTGAIRIGVQSGFNRFYGTYKEGDGLPAVLIDSGGEGHNLIDFRYFAGAAGETITDNSGAVSRTNKIVTGPAQEDRDNLHRGIVAGPVWGGPTTVALTANTAFFQRFVPARSMRVTKISFVVGTAASVDDAVDVGIYDTAGARVTSLGATSGLLNSTGVKSGTFGAPVVLKPGTAYYAAISQGTVGGTAAVVLARTTNLANGSVLFGTTLGLVEHGYYAASHPLPSSVGTTPNSNNTNPLLMVRED